MQRPSDAIGRKMIPRWRTLRLTPGQELVSAKGQKTIRNGRIAADATLEEWLDQPTIWSALDMVAMGLVDGKTRDTDAAAAFMQRHMDDVTTGARQLVLSYNSDDSIPRTQIRIQTTTALKFRRIRELKSEISSYPRNAVLQVEIARAYVSLGQVDQARHAFRVALALSPANRYVVRSAVRFFVLTHDVETAWSILQRTPKDDPWLMASRISVSDLLSKPVPSGRRLRDAIDAGNPTQVTELAAALATLELDSGSDKLAKRLFRKGCEAPTDNTIAQVRWAHETSGVPFDRALLNNELTFEARTGQAIEELKWRDAVDSASGWLVDEPFSTRAATTGAFLSAELLKDYDKSEQTATAGLLVNPQDPTLLNNRAYALANLGRTDDARKDIVTAMNGKDRTDSDTICLAATLGCVLYREGQMEIGSVKYKEAHETAVEQGNMPLAKRALVHWIAEEGRVGRQVSAESADRIKDYFLDPRKSDRETQAVFAANAMQYLGGEPTADRRSVSIEDAALRLTI